MDDWMIGLSGLALGSALTAAGLLRKRGRLHTALAEQGEARVRAEARADGLETRLDERAVEIERLRADLDRAVEQRAAAQREHASVTEQLAAERRRLDEQRALLEQTRTQLTETFTALSTQVLQANSDQFLKLARSTFDRYLAEARGDVEKRRAAIDDLVKPIRESLDRHVSAVAEMERKREGAYKGIEAQIRSIVTAHDRLHTETSRLVTALRRPEQRGRWGEMQLRNAVELAGMSEHCDFHAQPQTDDPETRDRPDMTVRMPGGGVIVVDSKVALEAYLTALEPDADRTAELRKHAEQVERHCRNLASKRYWEQFDRTPKLVVMFMPLESALVAALEVKPDLHAQAMERHVLIATPTLLVATLRAVAYGWQQEHVAAGAREIARTGAELYDRLATFTEHFEKVGAGLDRATRAYNKAIGSLDRRLLSTARALKRLHATSAADVAAPRAVTVEVRDVVASELRPLIEQADECETK